MNYNEKEMINRIILTAEQREFLLPKAFNAAVRAGAVILDVYAAGKDHFDVNLKSDMTPITLADRRSHTLIKEYLAQTMIPLLSEEGREMRYEERKDWEMFWMVDPLDGTKEFIKGNNEFTVNIALVANNRPVMGIIYVPYFQKIYFCEKGFGSYLKEGVRPDPNADYTYDKIYEGAVELPLRTEANSPLRLAISRSHNNEETFARLAEVKKAHPDAVVVEQGSSYKFCLLAEGSVDYYVRTTHTYEWDTAAGEVILSETGGTTKSLPGLGKFAYNKEPFLNPFYVCRSRFFQE